MKKHRLPGLLLLAAQNFLVVLSLCSLASSLSAQEVMHVQNGATLSIQNGATMTVAGGLNLDNGSLFLQGGTFTQKTNGPSGTSDWIDHTSTIGRSYGNGSFVFNGDGDQTLNTIVSFGTIKVQDQHLALSNHIRCQNLLLSQGVVRTDSFELFVVSPADTGLKADVSNAHFVNSWINGNLKRNINPTRFNRYDFPVGDSNVTRPVVLDNMMVNGLGFTNTLEVSFGAKPGTDAGLSVRENGTAFVSVNNGGVWHIAPDQAPVRGSYDLQLFFTGFTGLADGQFAILQRSDSSANAADWTVPAGSTLPAPGTPGRTVSDGFAQRNNLSVFGQFGIGMNGTALPITLLGFNARRVTTGLVNLDWQTGLEQNNKGFGIERKLDNENSFAGKGFAPSLAPGGNSHQALNYQYADPNNYSGVSYYRLQQEDLDGHSTYSIIKAVSGTSNNQVTISLYPNPGHGQFNLRIDGTDKIYRATITDELGRTIQAIDVPGNNNVRVTGLTAGLYFVKIPDVFGDGKSFIEKVLVVH